MVSATQRAGGQRQAHLRDPRPRAQRARAGEAGPSRPDRRAASSCAASASATATAPVLHDVDLTIQPGEMIGLVGPQRRGQEHAGQPGLPLLRRRPRARSWSTASTSARFRSRSTAATSASCCRSRSCSSARSPRTSPTAGPTPRARRSSPRPAPRRPTSSSCACRDGYDSLVGERGQSPLRRRAAADLDRPGAADRPAHPDPRRGHLVGRHRDRARDPGGARQPDPAAAPRSPSPTASARCARPTAWSCWSAARSSRSARTTS